MSTLNIDNNVTTTFIFYYFDIFPILDKFIIQNAYFCSRLPDLLVGAPFYFSRDVGGAVYLYLNINSSLHQEYNVKLTGKQESQFGIAIANAGDLNKDGCQDIAIGSPYEGNGVVYIYMGDREKGLNTKPDQVITAEALPVLMKTFGYALSGGVDLDANGYPDLLVGAYENVS